MQLQYYRVWQTAPVLNKLYENTTNGKLRHAAKRNARPMSSTYEDIMQWVRDDMKENEIEGDKLPFDDKGFMERFETFLIEEKVEFEPYLFSEDLMQYADGITGTQENELSWLFTENQPKDEPEEKDGDEGVETNE